MQSEQKDNSTGTQKIKLRRRALEALAGEAVILETHGGWGKIGDACYRGVTRGAVFEVKPDKARMLARKRPSWSVYEANVEPALHAGAGAHLPVNLLDIDPYGSPWSCVEAFFGSERDRQPEVHVVVNDGLLKCVKMKGAWQIAELEPLVQKYGSQEVLARYGELSRELAALHVARAGYEITAWTHYHCGHTRQMTHWHAVLRRVADIQERTERPARPGGEHRDYLRSAQWEKRRQKRLVQAAGRCEECGEKAQPLHVHHHTYERLGREKDEDLAVWCAPCHAAHHNRTSQAAIISGTGH